MNGRDYFWAAVLIVVTATIIALAIIAVATDAGAQEEPGVQIEPEVTVQVPPVTCTDGTYIATIGVDAGTLVRVLVADHLNDGTECWLPFEMEAGGYRAGDPVWNGHDADLPTLTVCWLLFHTQQDQRDCVRVRICETGSVERAVRREPSASNDYGAFQHSWRYIDGRFAAIGHPDGDRYDFWLSALAARWLWDQSGGSWRYWSCAVRVGAR